MAGSCRVSAVLLLGLMRAVAGGPLQQGTLFRGVSRQLADSCNSVLLQALPPPSLELYDQCLKDKRATVNMSVPGADAGIKAECWCEHNVKDAIEKHNCCGDPNYKQMCDIQCDNDCGNPEAIKCLTECPSMCFERDYGFESCNCDNCHAHIRCITEQGRNRTHAGDLDTICDDYGFDRSLEYRAFHMCTAEDHPKRTNWQRYQLAHYCACKSNLKAALTRHSCCGSNWGKPFCDLSCTDSVDCGTTEASQCLEDCGTKCHIVTPKVITKACHNTCLNKSAPCQRYATCPPGEQGSFEYLCLDGTAPGKNGCCPRLRRRGAADAESCPALCGVRQKFQFQHGDECQCYDCPTTKEAISAKMKSSIVALAVSHGQLLLATISSAAGLALGPTTQMQDLLRQRNEAIQEVINQHDGLYDSDLLLKIRVINRIWSLRIQEAARLARLCQDDPSKCKAVFGGDDRSLSIGLLVGGLLLLTAMLLTLYIYLMRRKRGAARPQALQVGSNAMVDPNPNVVVGRPVDASAALPRSEGAAVSGAPMASAKA